MSVMKVFSDIGDLGLNPPVAILNDENMKTGSVLIKETLSIIGYITHKCFGRSADKGRRHKKDSILRAIE